MNRADQGNKVLAALDLPPAPGRRARRPNDRRGLDAKQRRRANNRESAHYRRGLAKQSADEVAAAILALKASGRVAEQEIARLRSQNSNLEDLLAIEEAQCACLRRQVAELDRTVLETRQRAASAEMQARLAACNTLLPDPLTLPEIPPLRDVFAGSPEPVAAGDIDGGHSPSLGLTTLGLDEALAQVELFHPWPWLVSDPSVPPELPPNAIACPASSISTQSCRSSTAGPVVAGLRGLPAGRHSFLPRR